MATTVKGKSRAGSSQTAGLTHGYLQHLGGDRWKVKVYAGINPRTHKQMARTKTFRAASPKEASRLGQVFYGELTRKVDDVKAQRGTVAELAGEWLTDRRSTWSPSTLERNEGIVKRIVADLGHETLAKLSARQIDAWYAKLRKQGLGATTIRLHHRILSDMLKQGEWWEMSDRTATTKARPPAAVKFEGEHPTSELVNDMLARAKGMYGMAFHLLAASGARRGEVCGLRWSDIDTGTNVLHIRRAVVETQGKVKGGPPILTIGPTKGKREREVILDEFTVARIGAHFIGVTERARAVGGTLTRDSYMFPNLRVSEAGDPHGHVPMKPSWLTRAWNRLRGTSAVRLHDLRHWHASTLIAQGRPLPEVSGRLGHAQVSTTVDIYAYVTKGADAGSADVMSRMLGPAGQGSNLGQSA